jgi:hypothetical protein
MRRAVENFLEDPLAEEFLRGNIKQGDTLEVHAAGEQLALKVTVSRSNVNGQTASHFGQSFAIRLRATQQTEANKRCPSRSLA